MLFVQYRPKKWHGPSKDSMQLDLGLFGFCNGCDDTAVIKLFSVDQNKVSVSAGIVRLTENQEESLTDGADKATSTIALSCPRRASSASPISATVMMYRLRIVLEVNRFIPCERSVDADRLAYL
jgi:hypothetical protein